MPRFPFPLLAFKDHSLAKENFFLLVQRWLEVAVVIGLLEAPRIWDDTSAFRTPVDRAVARINGVFVAGTSDLLVFGPSISDECLGVIASDPCNVLVLVSSTPGILSGASMTLLLDTVDTVMRLKVSTEVTNPHGRK